MKLNDYLQRGVHGSESLLGLVKEAENNGGAELMVVWLVHLQNLVEGVQVHKTAVQNILGLVNCILVSFINLVRGGGK